MCQNYAVTLTAVEKFKDCGSFFYDCRFYKSIAMVRCKWWNKCHAGWERYCFCFHLVQQRRHWSSCCRSATYNGACMLTSSFFPSPPSLRDTCLPFYFSKLKADGDFAEYSLPFPRLPTVWPMVDFQPSTQRILGNRRILNKNDGTQTAF